MKRLFFSFLLACLTAAGSAQINLSALDSLTQQAAAAGFEGNVLVADEGQVVFHQSVGHADASTKVVIDADTHFSIASITKTFTAVVILQLVDEGKLSLTTPLSQLLPELDVRKGNKITPHHLLLHLSGLPNEPESIYTKPVSPFEFVTQVLEGDHHKFNQFNYANIDYVLLGLIIEAVDGQPWEAAVRKRILEPAGMTATGLLKMGAYPENFAYSFSFGSGEARNPDPLFYIENFWAAGCMYSTTADLLKFDQFLRSERAMSASSKAQMYTSHPEFGYVGYSVWTYDYYLAPGSPRFMERRGGILGANSTLVRMLDTNKTLIILSNNDKFNPDSFGNPADFKEAMMITLATP